METLSQETGGWYGNNLIHKVADFPEWYKSRWEGADTNKKPFFNLKIVGDNARGYIITQSYRTKGEQGDSETLIIVDSNILRPDADIETIRGYIEELVTLFVESKDNLRLSNRLS